MLVPAFSAALNLLEAPRQKCLARTSKKNSFRGAGLVRMLARFFFSGGADAHVALMHVAPFPIVPHENAPMAVRIEALWQVSIGPLVGWCADGVFRARCEIPGVVPEVQQQS